MDFLIYQYVAVALCVLVLVSAFIKHLCKCELRFISFILSNKYTIIGVALGFFYCIYNH